MRHKNASVRFAIALLALVAFVYTSIRASANPLEIPDNEYNALVALYNSTDGANWISNTNWLTDISPWYGVTIADGHVAGIGLTSNNLKGQIPGDLGFLVGLQSLDLSDNALTGAIPAELGSLTSLQNLVLNYNQLSGSIPPELGNAAALQSLRLRNNQLTGTLPHELGNLANLQYLYLDGNQLTGTIPTSLANLANLRTLNLTINQLSGAIPDELQQLHNLQNLQLAHNALIGVIPPGLADLTNLRRLDLGNNQLSGQIPSGLGSLILLTYLGVDRNQLSGPIPPELGSLTQLTGLFLNGNKFTGQIPAELGNLTNLNTLFLSGNQLSGTIPSTLANLTTINTGWLDLSYNCLSATDPVLLDYLAIKSSVWNTTQTVPPRGLAVSSTTTDSVTLTWLPIIYSGSDGYYEVGISGTNGGPYTFDPTNRTSGKTESAITVSGLTPGQTYYFVIRTVSLANPFNQSLLTSDASAEIPGTTDAPPAEPVPFSKSLADRTLVKIEGARISASVPDEFYAENPDRTWGIRVTKQAHGLTAGEVTVVGTLRTDGNGERYIEAQSATSAGSVTVAPLFLIAKSLGGADAGFEANATTGQRGVTGGLGPNNIGLLVRTFGVTRQTQDGIAIQDGSKVNVLVRLQDGSSAPHPNNKVVITGISSLELIGGNYVRMIKVFKASDVATVLE